MARDDSYVHSDITELVIQCAFSVHNALGIGFLEKVYENALALEIAQKGLQVERQPALNVSYKGTSMGDFYPDLIVEGKVIVEIKAQQQVHPAHEMQLTNYLKVSGLQVGLLLNFGSSVHIRRKYNEGPTAGS
jgi:GxxExxY protein